MAPLAHHVFNYQKINKKENKNNNIAHPQHPPQPSIEVPWSPLLCPLHSPLGLNFLRKEDLRGWGKFGKGRRGGGGATISGLGGGALMVL